MTKLFIQLMLSVILSVGVGAAMGFNPKVRTDIHDIVLQANPSVHENVSATVKDTYKKPYQNLLGGANLDTVVSLKTNVVASMKSNVKADLNLKNDLKTKINKKDVSTVNKLPEPSANNSVTNGAQTNLEVDISVLDLGIKDKINSALNLNLGLGK